MKTKIINKILNEMKPFLKDEEFIKLDNIINNVFNDVEIIKKEISFNVNDSKNNENLLNNFLAAKEIEGCSNKTLVYYRSHP